jgi:hypothetical protein
VPSRLSRNISINIRNHLWIFFGGLSQLTMGLPLVAMLRDVCYILQHILETPAPRRQASRHYIKANVRVHGYEDGSMAIFHGPRRLADYDRDGEAGQLKTDFPRLNQKADNLCATKPDSSICFQQTKGKKATDRFTMAGWRLGRARLLRNEKPREIPRGQQRSWPPKWPVY